MARIFLTTFPYLQQGSKRFYDAVDDARLAASFDTTFPILLSIWGFARPGETVRVMPLTVRNTRHELGVRSDGTVPQWDSDAAEASRDSRIHANVAASLERLREELRAVEEAKGLSCSVEPLDIDEDETVDGHIRLFGQLCDRIQAGDVVHADITYYTKPTPLVVFSALNYLYEAVGLRTECVTYGLLADHGNPTARGQIHNVTPLFRMNSIIERLPSGKVADAGKELDLLLNL